MDLLIEIILEIVFEGVFITATCRRVPLPLRIIASILVFGIFGGVIFLIVFLGFNCIGNPKIPHGNFCGAVMFLTASVLFVGIFYRVILFLKNRRFK